MTDDAKASEIMNKYNQLLTITKASLIASLIASVYCNYRQHGNSCIKAISFLVHQTTMFHASGRTLRKRFLTKEEKVAWGKVQEKKKQEARVKALRESNLKKAKAKKDRELKERRAKTLMESSIQACEPEFRQLVEQWAKGKTVAKVNRFFSMLEEVKCPMEPCGSGGLSEKVLRLNKCGYEKLCYGLNLPDAILGCDFWDKDYQRQYDRAHELESILYDIHV